MAVVADDRPHQLAGRQVPDVDRAVDAARGGELTIRAECQGIEPAAMLTRFDGPAQGAGELGRLVTSAIRLIGSPGENESGFGSIVNGFDLGRLGLGPLFRRRPRPTTGHEPLARRPEWNSLRNRAIMPSP